jgi:hypothetical protein
MIPVLGSDVLALFVGELVFGNKDICRFLLTIC